MCSCGINDENECVALNTSRSDYQYILTVKERLTYSEVRPAVLLLTTRGHSSLLMSSG